MPMVHPPPPPPPPPPFPHQTIAIRALRFLGMLDVLHVQMLVRGYFTVNKRINNNNEDKNKIAIITSHIINNY